MNAYVSPEEEARKKQFNEDNARYTAQNHIAISLNNFIKSLESQKEHAEKVLNWVQADKWRDLKISTLEDQMKRLGEQGKRIEEMFNVELRRMRSSLSSHVYDDYDWHPQVSSNTSKYYDLVVRLVDLEKENKLLMTKMLELEQKQNVDQKY